MNKRAWLRGLESAAILGITDPTVNLLTDPTKLENIETWKHTALLALAGLLVRVAIFVRTNPTPEDDVPADKFTPKFPVSALVFAMGLACFTGCATTQQDVHDSLPIITSATEIASGVVLQFAVKDTATRQEIAAQMYGVASAVRTLSGGAVPSVEQFKATILSFTPKYPHWVDLSASLSSVYATYFVQIKGDPKLALEVLEAIARGVENGAARMAPQPQPVAP